MTTQEQRVSSPSLNFETTFAATLASILELLSLVVSLLLVFWSTSSSNSDNATPTLLLGWHIGLWLLPHFLLTRNRVSSRRNRYAVWLNTWLVYTWVALIVAIPHLFASSDHLLLLLRGVYGPASLRVATRSLQIWWDQDAFAGWGRWQRMFFLSPASAFVGHDLRFATPVRSRSEGLAVFKYFCKKLAFFSLLLACSAAILWRLGSVPPQYHIDYGIGESYSTHGALSHSLPLSIGLKLQEVNFKLYKFYLSFRHYHVLRYYILRWLAGAFMVYSGFQILDAFPGCFHALITHHKLESISNAPLSAQSTQELWFERWNRPIARLLLTQSGQFSLGPKRYDQVIKTAAFFVLNGLVHTYFLTCANRPIEEQLQLFSFFLLQLPVLALETIFGWSGSVVTFLPQLLLVPLFVQPTLAFLHM